MKVPAKRSRRDLHAASDAFFLHPIDLTQDLDKDPHRTIRKLQQDPESFAPIRPSLEGEWFRKAYLRLLAAALVYVRAEPPQDDVDRQAT